MKRDDCVVIFMDEGGRIRCLLCKNPDIRGEECPFGGNSKCSYPKSSEPVSFNNELHKIIATRTMCYARSFGCSRDCSRCAIKRTISGIEVR